MDENAHAEQANGIGEHRSSQPVQSGRPGADHGTTEDRGVAMKLDIRDVA